MTFFHLDQQKPLFILQKISSLIIFMLINRDDRIRTCGILLPKQARYQAALHPEKIALTFGLHNFHYV